jgi:hypothetical protein
MTRKAPKKPAKKKSTVNKAGNYTKPEMRKRLFNKIKAGSRGGKPDQHGCCGITCNVGILWYHRAS